MDQTTDQIRREIEQARERISETTSQLGERIRSTFDWRQQVAEHPWPAVGIATAAGFLLGAAAGRAMGGGSEWRASESYGEGHTYDRIGNSVESQAPGTGGREWSGGSPGASAGYGTSAASGGQSRTTGVMASLVGALAPQFQEIGRNLAGQLKDLSQHFMEQGKEYVKERVEDWRGRSQSQERTGGYGGYGPGGSGRASAQSGAGGSNLSSEAAGSWSAGATGAGSTGGTGSTSGSSSSTGSAYGSGSGYGTGSGYGPGSTSGAGDVRESRDTMTPQSRERESGERRAGGR